MTIKIKLEQATGKCGRPNLYKPVGLPTKIEPGIFGLVGERQYN